jgi:chaperone modulatory protein CbpM
MISVDDLVEKISALQRSDLDAWIREELVAPQEEAGSMLFTDMEYARVRLICALHYELEIDAETLSVVLSLVDQLYAIAAQDKDVQEAIIGAMKQQS